MKKMLYSLMAAALFLPLIAGAVSWTGDSNQFKWNDGTATISGNRAAASQFLLKSRTGYAKGVVTFFYQLPSPGMGATLSIFNLSGVLIKEFALDPAGRTVQWGVSKDRTAAGVYVASMRCGQVNKKIQIAIVK